MKTKGLLTNELPLVLATNSIPSMLAPPVGAVMLHCIMVSLYQPRLPLREISRITSSMLQNYNCLPTCAASVMQWNVCKLGVW